MPRRQKIRKQRPSLPITPRRRITRRRRVSRIRETRQSTSASLAKYFAKGTRSVLAALPGSPITTAVADFVFSSLGWSAKSPSSTTESSESTISDVRITGLGGVFDITPAMFFGSMQGVGLIKPAMQGNPELADILFQWRAARISVLKIIARPSGPLGSVSGTWAIGFTPYTTDDARNMIPTSLKKSGVTFETIKQCPVFAIGDVNKPLAVRHFFQFQDGIAYLPQQVTSTVGVVQIAYQDVMRSVWTDLTAADFQCTIDCSASVVCSSRDPSSFVGTTNRVQTPIIDVSAHVSTPSGRLSLGGSSFKCTKNSKTGFCDLSGVVASFLPKSDALMTAALLLDSMEM